MIPVPPIDPVWASWLVGVLMHAAWIGVVVAMLAWLPVTHMRDPRVRHGAALAALLLIAAGVAAAGWATWPAAAVARSGPPAVVTMPATTAASLPASTTTEAAFAPTLPGPADWHSWLAICWTIGALLLMLRRCVGHGRVMLLRSTAISADGDLARRITACCQRIGLPTPLLLVSNRIAVPAASGWLRPAVLIPACLLDLPAAQFEALVLHELAHLRRRDALVESVIGLLECLFFFHPAVWWLTRQVRVAREQCCDQSAVAAGAEPDGLARALLAVAERLAAPSPALAASGGELAVRVRRILGVPERHRRPRSALVAALVLLLLTGGLAACAAMRSSDTPTSVPVVPAHGGVMDRAYPLDRRIRARARGGQIAARVHMIEAEASVLEALGLSAERRQRLGRDQAAAVLRAASDANLVTQVSITTFPLQRASASFLQQHAHLADYRIVDGQPDPQIRILDLGDAVELVAEPGPSGGVLLVDLSARSARHIGTELSHFTWPSPEDDGREYPFEEASLLFGETALGDPELLLQDGEAVALTMHWRVQREVATFRASMPSIRPGTPVALPDPARLPRRIIMVTAQTIDGFDPPARHAVAPSARSWFDACRVSLHATDASLTEVLQTLGDRLPVPVWIVEHPDHAATRVTIQADDEPLSAVLDRLLPQTLLDAQAVPAGLLFHDTSPADFPAQRLGNATALNPAEGPRRTKRMLAWPPALLPAVSQLYDVADLVDTAASSGSPSNGWEIASERPDDRPTDLAELVTLVEGLVPGSWGDGRSVEGVDGKALVVAAAPDVQRLVAMTLADLRATPADRISVRADLIRFTGTSAQRLAAISQELADEGSGLRIVAPVAAHELREMYGRTEGAVGIPSPAVPLRTWQRCELRRIADDWSNGLSVAVRPVLSADRRYITIELEWRTPSTGAKRSSVALPAGSAVIIGASQPGMAYLVQAEALP
jgi:beta-lactamase regulating signal transducer with metallopeptidase domain